MTMEKTQEKINEDVDAMNEDEEEMKRKSKSAGKGG
jgi:hypothetical protein